MRALAFACVLLAGAALAGEAAPAPGGQLILDEGSLWRMSASWGTPVVRKGAELKACDAPGWATRTAPLPADWAGPDFADGIWSRWSLGRERKREYDYGFTGWGAPGPTLSRLCLRGKFAVEDPARVQKLTLALAYRGGVVVYVNGQEAARAHLPKDGKIEPETLAEDYPAEAFVHEGSFRGSTCILAEWGHPAKYKDQLEKRIRRLDNVTIDAKLLRKGANVLAVEIHRAPYFGIGLEMEGMNHGSVWSTAGLVSLTLRAEAGVAPNLSRPPGIQVWAASSMIRPSPMAYGDPLEKSEPVAIVGCQNGAFDGKVMVSADKPLAAIKAQATDLKHRDGQAVIPAAAVKLLYTVRDDRMVMRYGVPKGGFWYPLVEEPPARVEAVEGLGACQAIVLKVRVPADAAPGDYSGKLTVSAEGLAATDVPVELRVVGWKLPDPRDFGTHMGVIQSPDTVAIQYKVPLWSEEHWKYMEESFKLLAEIGNNYVVVPIISRTNFGNEQSMIRWIKDGDAYKHDFAIFDRYLDLAQKYQKVDVVCLYAFEMYVGCVETSKGNVSWTKGKKSGAMVTLWDPKTGKSEDLEGPLFENPEEYRKFWGPVCKEIAARLAKRGLADAMMLGISGDYGGGGRPTKEAADLYKELLPGVKWVANPHADCRGESMGGIPIGYNTQYYMNICPPPESGKRYYGWQTRTDYHARARGPTAPLAFWRACAESSLVHNCSGRGRVGADFWPVLAHADWKNQKAANAREKASNSIGARYPESDWSQLNLDRGTEVILAPGPRGALATENFEQIRQGLQESQARIFIEKAILAKKLDPELAKRCQDLLDLRTHHLRGLGASGGAGSFEALGGWMINVWYEGFGSAGLSEKLFAAAAEVAAKTGAK